MTNEERIKKARMNAAILRTKRKMAEINPPEPTIEDKILSSPVINNPVVDFGIDVLQAAGKGMSHLTTPLTESARGVVRGTRGLVGQDMTDTPELDLLAEFDSPLGAPSEKAGFQPLALEVMKLFGVENEPLLDPEWEQFPRASAAVKALSTPAGAASTLAEFAIPGVNLSKGNLGGTARNLTRGAKAAVKSPITAHKGVRNWLASKGYATKDMPSFISSMPEFFDRRGIYERWLATSAPDKVVLRNLLDSGRIEDVIDLLVDDPSLMKPLGMGKTLDVLEGPKASKTTGPYDSINVYGRDIKSGQIGELASSNRGILDQLDPYKAPMSPPSHIDFKESVMRPIRPDYSPKQRASAEDFLDEQLHRFAEPYEKRQALQRLNREEKIVYARLQEQLDVAAKEALDQIDAARASAIARFESIPDRVPSPDSSRSLVTGQLSADIPNPQKELARIQLERELSSLDNKSQSLSSRENIILSDLDPREFPRVAKAKDDLVRLDSKLQEAYETHGPYSDRDLARFDFDQQQQYYKRLDDTRKDSNRLLNVTDFTADPWTKDIKTKAAKGLESVTSTEIEQAILNQLGPEALQSYLEGNKGISQRIMLRDLYGSSRIPVSKMPSLEGRPSTKSASIVAQARDSIIMPYSLKAKDAIDKFSGNVLAPLAEISQPFAIQSYRIPREVQRIMAERELIAEKINDVIGEEAANTFMSLEDPDAVKEYLRQLEEVNSNIFVKDAYRRFDGEIKDPVLKNKALEDTLKSPVSVFDRARTVNELLLNNRLQGQNQAS